MRMLVFPLSSFYPLSLPPSFSFFGGNFFDIPCDTDKLPPSNWHSRPRQKDVQILNWPKILITEKRAHMLWNEIYKSKKGERKVIHIFLIPEYKVGGTFLFKKWQVFVYWSCLFPCGSYFELLWNGFFVWRWKQYQPNS